MMGYLRHMAACAALALLTGCGGGTEKAPLELELLREGQQAIAARRAGGTAGGGTPITRALLNTTIRTLADVSLERTGQNALLYRSAVRQDDQPGLVEVWRSLDDVSLSTRNGVLIATRGLAGNILSGSVQVAEGRPGPASGGEHVLMIRSLDDRQVRLSLACELVDLGSETIEIIERRHATRHLQHRCVGGGGEVVNDYWVDMAADIVWQSRQWAGPHIGYIRLRRLTVR
ncbi:MAG: YjbF family lipoprotein [Marinibacterium sp.]|nr:YjbF family lipoprotein [Marinibacterium sp.]